MRYRMQILKSPNLTPAQRVDRMYHRILSRAADPADADAALTYIPAFQQRGHTEAQAWQSYCHALMASNAFMYVD